MTRIADAKPKVIVSASCGLEPGRVVQYKPLLDLAIALSPHKPDACLILQREQSAAALTPGRDFDLLAAEAAKYTLADHFFHSSFGGSFLNNMFLIAAAALTAIATPDQISELAGLSPRLKPYTALVPMAALAKIPEHKSAILLSQAETGARYNST